MKQRAYMVSMGYLGYKVVGPFGNESEHPMDKDTAERLVAQMNQEVNPHENDSRVDTALDAAPPAPGL